MSARLGLNAGPVTVIRQAMRIEQPDPVPASRWTKTPSEADNGVDRPKGAGACGEASKFAAAQRCNPPQHRSSPHRRRTPQPLFWTMDRRRAANESDWLAGESRPVEAGAAGRCPQLGQVLLSTPLRPLKTTEPPRFALLLG
ncbi:hypothetical protein CMQ_5677 [Grosmannia clavigera kw1407]|uniref:Uncharacterized protein n=1 Tax=Grosmannia clavigera (strain kw1407 / UAMH 11150) TaxID=655863 RepID=F0XSU5_GROCL|nr:uncharacterized protein CMQ_5677 [Grosmannia clavigera kw1407]EFW99256.1 hypothetical protein CMQ_5677 [Grosmannia clavigera kw1407]